MLEEPLKLPVENCSYSMSAAEQILSWAFPLWELLLESTKLFPLLIIFYFTAENANFAD